MNLRKTTSLTTLLAFILLITTSIVLYITPQGKIAFWANWSCWGLGKETWGALHTNIGLLFIISALLHTTLNLKSISAYLKNKAKKTRVFTGELNIALGILAVVILFTLLEIPPLKGIQDLNEHLKSRAASLYGEPPYAHAESASLNSFCRRTQIPLKDAMKKLRHAGIQFNSAQDSLSQMARSNKTTPQAIYEIIKPSPEEHKTTPFPQSPGFGFGRKRLLEVCQTYGLESEATLEHLQALGITATASQTIKSIAEENDTEAISLFEVLRQME